MVDASLGSIRERIPMAETVEVARERERLSIDRDLVDWVNDNCQAGGWFRSHGDAAEKALGRLRAEYVFIQDHCREAGTPFDVQAFYALYDEDVKAVSSAVGRPTKGHSREAPDRVMVRATMATELVAWANRTWLKQGPAERLAQVVAVGLRRLRAGGHRVRDDQEEPKVTLPPKQLWDAFRARVK